MSPLSALGQQTAATLTTGSVSVRLKRVNTILGATNANPLFGTHAPGDSRLFLVQQGTNAPNPDLPGRILYVDPNVVDGPVGTLLDFNVQLPGVLDITHFEKGLLGLAFHPRFNDPASSGYLKFYTYTSEVRTAHGTPDFIHPETATNPATLVNNIATLREWTANSPTPTGVAGPSRVVMTIADPQNQHNGGTIAFSPADGYLYWGLGDGGGNSSNSPDFVASAGGIDSTTDGHTNSTGPGAPHGNGQDRTNPLGAMLRINPLRAADAPDANALSSDNGQYQIPLDNPFTMQSNIDPDTSQLYAAWDPAWVDEIYAYGLRNPYRFSFDHGVDELDPNRGKLYLADAGYNDREEVDLITPGGNYGWVIREGTESMEGVQGIPAYKAPVNARTGLPDELIDPVAEYEESIGIATIGGFVYRGSSQTDLAGKYVFGDYQSPLRNGDGLLLYFDVNEPRDPGEPFTIYRLGTTRLSASPPNADLLGFGEGADGTLYALFDNGQIYSLNPIFSADFDEDGAVDAADLTAWQAAFETSATGDADGDSDSDGADFLAWQRQLGGGAATIAASAVPEPAAALLVVGGCIGLPTLLRRQGRRPGRVPG
jgi:glucose/arabinose dehydrogenase